SFACRQPAPTTAGCSRSCATWTPEGRPAVRGTVSCHQANTIVGAGRGMRVKAGAVQDGSQTAVKRSQREHGPHYKWIALSNTTLGVLMATINLSIVLIALPDIFRGIGLNPLSPGNTSYLLWMFMGFLVVSAVLVVSFGRLG